MHHGRLREDKEIYFPMGTRKLKIQRCLGTGHLLQIRLLARHHQYSRRMEGKLIRSRSMFPTKLWNTSYFFSLVGSSVKIHSVATGEVVSSLSAPPSTNNGSSSLLTTAILNPHNAFQLITGSLDGRVMVWDFLDAALLKTIDIEQPIHCMCAHENFHDSVFVAASRSSKKAKISGAGASHVLC